MMQVMKKKKMQGLRFLAPAFFSMSIPLQLFQSFALCLETDGENRLNDNHQCCQYPWWEIETYDECGNGNENGEVQVTL